MHYKNYHYNYYNLLLTIHLLYLSLLGSNPFQTGGKEKKTTESNNSQSSSPKITKRNITMVIPEITFPELTPFIVSFNGLHNSVTLIPSFQEGRLVFKQKNSD